MTRKRKIGAIIWTSLLFTVFVYLGAGSMTWGVLFFFLGCILVGVGMALAGEKLQGKFHLFAWDDRIAEYLRSSFSDRALLFQAWFLILLSWVPVWLACFPGTFGYDTPIQLSMYLGEIELTSANPLVHTWIVGGVICLGNALFGSYQAGFTLFVILQLLLISNCMANMALFLFRKRVPLSIIVAGLLWTVTHPVVQILNLNSTKDILCGTFLAFFVMAFWDILEEKEERKLSEYIKVFFFGLMICLLRNAILFLVVALLIVSLLMRLKEKKVMLTLLGVVVCVEVFSLLCSGIFRIPKGDLRENLCIPIQQMATVIYRHQTGRERIENQVDLESLAELFPGMESFGTEFDPYCADGPKLCFQTEVFRKDPGKYISLYFRLGARNPGVYLDAVKNLILPYWHMELNEYRGLSYTYTFPDINHWDIKPEYPDKLVRYRMWMVEEIETFRCPFWRQPGLCIWLLAALSGMMIARKEKRGLLKILPIAVYFIGILMGPVALLRYIYPVMLTTPILFGMLFRRGPGR